MSAEFSNACIANCLLLTMFRLESTLGFTKLQIRRNHVRTRFTIIQKTEPFPKALPFSGCFSTLIDFING